VTPQKEGKSLKKWKYSERKKAKELRTLPNTGGLKLSLGTQKILPKKGLIQLPGSFVPEKGKN